MTSAGVAIDTACVSEFNEFKLRNKYRFIIFKVTDDLKQIQIHKTAPPTASYAEFLAELPANEPRYAVYNFEYDSEDGHRAKIVFFIWAPDSSKTKLKMIYASSKDSLKKAFVGLSIEIQGTDRAEVDEAEVIARCKSVSK